MNCCSCLHARHAGNAEMVGCRYWTAIYRGDKDTVRNALKKIIKLEDLEMDTAIEFSGRECISVLIDRLINKYAPKPIFEGWADLERPLTTSNQMNGMTNFCVVLNPERLCNFYTRQPGTPQ